MHAQASRRLRVLARKIRRVVNTTISPEVSHSADDHWTTVIELAQFGAFVAFAHRYLLSTTQCIGPSMQPTIGTGGDVVVVWPTSQLPISSKPQLGDVVVCTSPTDPSLSVCKRILGDHSLVANT